MTEPVSFTAQDRSEYRLTVSANEIQLDCWFPSSIGGGSDTECGHTITGIEALHTFLDATEFGSLSILVDKCQTFDEGEWILLHKQVKNHQTGRFIWD